MLTLSNQGAYTPFHQDPIAGETSGAGWMWLLSGAKRWHFLTNDHSDAIFDPATNALNDFPTEDLVRADGWALGQSDEGRRERWGFLVHPAGVHSSSVDR